MSTRPIRLDKIGALFRPGLHHHPRALAQRDPRRWPARDRGLVGRLRDLKVIDASDVLKDAIRGAVPDIHAEGKVGLGLHTPSWRPSSPSRTTPSCCPSCASAPTPASSKSRGSIASP